MTDRFRHPTAPFQHELLQHLSCRGARLRVLAMVRVQQVLDLLGHHDARHGVPDALLVRLTAGSHGQASRSVRAADIGHGARRAGQPLMAIFALFFFQWYIL